MPDDVRTALESHPAVLGAAVVGRPDERLGETPVAMVELRGGAASAADELAAYLRTRLARYEIPTDIAIVDAIPRTPSGKADLSAVRQSLRRADVRHARRPWPEGEPTVGSVVRDRARTRGDHPLLVCDDDRLSYAEAERRSASLARGLIALGVGKGTHVGLLYPNGLDVRRSACWPPPGSVRSSSRSPPSPRRASSREQLVDSDVAILLAATSYRSHDYVPALRRGARRRGSARRATDAPRRPQLRHVVFDVERLCRAGESVDEALLPAMEDDVDGVGPAGHRLHLGLDGHAEGRGAHPRRAADPPAQPQRDPRRCRADDRLFCNSPFFWIGGLRASACSPPSSPARRWCARTPSTRVRHPRPAGGRAAHDHQRFRSGGRAPRPTPELRPT